MEILSPTVKQPLAIWVQLSSLCFFLAGNFSDLLIVRLCLSSAYVCLFCNSILGAPLWPLLRNPGAIQLDALLWAMVNLYVHVSTVVRLFHDERPVYLSDEHEALWRMFYRTGGLSPVLFEQAVAKYCHVVTLKEGDPLDTRRYFYIIYKGAIQLTLFKPSEAEKGQKRKKGFDIISSRKAHSGQLFDFRALELLEEYPHMDHHELHGEVASPTATLFCFQKRKMPRVVRHPATRLLWKEMLMENLLRIVRRYFVKVEGGAGFPDDYVNPLFEELESWEQPHPLRAGSGFAGQKPLRHVLASMFWSFAPPWPWQGPPLGLRHGKGLLPQGTKETSTKMENGENEPLLSSVPWKSHNKGDSRFSNTLVNRNDIFWDHLNQLDDAELGGMDLVQFQSHSSSVV